MTKHATPDRPSGGKRGRNRLLQVGGTLGFSAAAVLGWAVLGPAAAGPVADARVQTASIRPISWAACPGSAETLCGNIEVPLDWSRPDGEKIILDVTRRPADTPSHSLGTLFFNPGGPGESPAQYITSADDIFSAGLRARFDVVGLDPRAVSAHARVHCKVPALTADDTLFPKTRAQFIQMRTHNAAVGRSCLEHTGALLGHTDTVTLARDHEALRKALHVETVSWLGLSYGTQVAANYAELFPNRTRVMVLDAALEHSLQEVQQVADETLAAEDSFNRFAAWCPHSPGCALQGRPVAAVFDRLVAHADRDPIPVPGALRAVTGEDIRMGTKGLLRFKEPAIFGPDLSWGGLSRALQAAIQGDASAFAVPADAPQDELFATLAIGCMEYAPQVDSYERMRQRIEMGRQLAPHLQGATETWQVNRCIDWPLPPANPPRMLHVTGVPTLVVHATHDPSVPYAWAHSLAAQIRGSHVLTRIGDGHTSYYTSPCARAAIDNYLTHPATLPPEVCDS
jgi:pimeloyl-ACP methyl ester carboxylesterase